MQFNHLFLKSQGIMESLLKAITTNEESDSTHIFFQFLWNAISVALITESSAWTSKIFSKTRKQICIAIPKNSSTSWGTWIRCFISVTLNPFWVGRRPNNSMLTGLGGWMMTSNFFKVTKSLTDELETLEVLFPERLTADWMPIRFRVLKSALVPWVPNCAKDVTMVACITVLHWGDQPLS